MWLSGCAASKHRALADIHRLGGSTARLLLFVLRNLVSQRIAAQADAATLLMYTGDALMTTTTLTVRVRPEIAERLGTLAQATQRTKSYLAAEAIEEYLALQEWHVQAILDGVDETDRGEGVELERVRRTWEAKLADTADKVRGG